MFKKITAAALLIAMALSATSCGGGNDGGTGDTTTSGGDTTTSAPEDTSPKLELPETNYNGQEFNMLLTTHASYEYDAEEETGDVVEDAVYRRNKTVEEQLGINFNFRIEPGQWGD